KRANGIGKTSPDICVVYFKLHGAARCDVTARHQGRPRLAKREGGTDEELYPFCFQEANLETVLLLEVAHDGKIHFIAGHPERVRVPSSAKADNSYLSRSTADVDHHRRYRPFDR